jgi:tetratricopeptide (TPR) repeat protein/tRNA A-37 threonylcarbamoyl transferase component Bud32
MPRDTLALDGMAGTVLEDKYRLVRVLGSGAMAHVYEAEQLRLGRSVAVKMLRVALLSDRKSLERFRTEALAASRINHPNAIAIYDVGITPDGVPFIVMEHLRGITLAGALAAQRFPVERIVNVGAQILSALEEAHGCGVIHRDLKSENVVLEARRDGTDFVKVLDFGIAAFVGSGDQSVVGTPEYMAPEQIRGDPPRPATDLYAMGVMLYEMIVGRTPFAGVSLTTLLERHLTEAPVPPDELAACPEILSATVLRALEKDPEARFEDARAMREALLAVLGGTRRSCGNCGARVIAGTRFCSACGVDFGEQRVTPATPPGGVQRVTLACGSGPVGDGGSAPRPRPTRLTFDLSGDATALAGRGGELARIGEWLAAGPSAPRTLGLVGADGAGKARLALEVVRARVGELVTFIAAPDPSGHQQSWYPILSMIEAVLGLPPRPSFEELSDALVRLGLPARDAPGLAELFAVAGPLASLELAVRRRETFSAAVRTLGAVEHRFPRPVFCFIDIDRYDHPSRKVVEMLATAVAGTRIRMIVTAASADAVPAGSTILPVPGLDPADAHALLVRLVGDTRAQAVPPAHLAALTGGNPAHVQQLAGWLVLDNDLSQLPQRLVDLVASRLGHLPANARRLLQAIAAHGQVASRADLGALADDIDATGAALATLVRKGLVVANDDDMTIPFALVAQVAEACTPAETRRALATSILEQRAADLPVVLLGHHAEAAEQLDRALEAFITAGDDAVRRFDDPRAAALFHRATTLARRLQSAGDPGGARAVVAVSLRLADVLRYMGELALASGCLDEAELFSPDQTQQAGLLRARGRIALMSGNAEAASQLLRRAIGLAFRSGETEFLCETYVDLASALAALGSVADAVAELGEAVDALTFGEGLARAGRPARLWMLGLRLASLHLRGGNTAHAKQVARDSLAHAERTGSLIGQGRLHTLLARIFEETGDTHAALSHQARALDHMRRLGDRRTTAELLLACARITGEVNPQEATGAAGRRSKDAARKAVDIANELAAEIGWDAAAQTTDDR